MHTIQEPPKALTGPRLLQYVVVLDEHAPVEIPDEGLEQPALKARPAQSFGLCVCVCVCLWGEGGAVGMGDIDDGCNQCVSMNIYVGWGSGFGGLEGYTAVD
jgi:hypothetical protein